MSNVLIGIIGVILFIGLALAGALILGDDFKSASSSSQAAALMAQLKQAADAAEMRRLKLGVGTTPATETSFLVPRFLKTPAVNPTSLGRAAPTDPRWTVSFNNNLYADGFYEPIYAAKYVQAVIGPLGDAKAMDVCRSIAETYGQSAIVDSRNDNDSDQPNLAGCVLVNSGPVFDQVPQYVAYVRVAPRGQSYLMPSGF
jgi:hypothetical protein